MIESRWGTILEAQPVQVPKNYDVKIQLMYQWNRNMKPFHLLKWSNQFDAVTFVGTMPDHVHPYIPVDWELDDKESHTNIMGIKRDECLLPTQYVWSFPVPKMLKDVNIGDDILDMYGELGKVIDKRVVNYDGEVVDFTIGRMTSLTASSNHRLWIARLGGYEGGRGSIHNTGERAGESYWLGSFALLNRRFVYSWIPASEIVEGDYLVLPKHNLEWGEVNRIYTRKSETYRKMVEEVVVDEEVAWLLGIYTAEGSYAENYMQVSFAFNLKDEMPLADKVSEIISRRFNLTGQKSIRPKDSSLCIIVRSSLLGELLVENCGKGSHNKHIPKSVFTSPLSVRIAYLRGLFEGDGNIKKTGNVPDGLKFTTASKRLVNEVAFLMASLNVPCKVCISPPKSHFIGRNLVRSSESYFIELRGQPVRLFGYDCPDRKRFSMVIATKNWLHLPVREVHKRRYVGELVDLETSGGTFLMPFISHNSRDSHLVLTNYWYVTNPPHLKRYSGRTGWVVARITYADLEAVVDSRFRLKLEHKTLKDPEKKEAFKREHELIFTNISRVVSMALNAQNPCRITLKDGDIETSQLETETEEELGKLKDND